MRNWLYALAAMAAGLWVGASVLGQGATTAATTTSKPVLTRPYDLTPVDVTTRAADLQKDPLAFVPGSSTLVLLPDVQNYNNVGSIKNQREKYMMQWIVAQKAARNIPLAINTGDITNHDDPGQWANARAAFEILDRKLPYIMVTGNHDYVKQTARGTKLNDYFKAAQNPLNDPAKGGILGGTFQQGRLENAWYRFEAAGKKYVVIVLEWAPRDVVVEWANTVAGEHKEERLILVTHAYIYNDSLRYDWAKHGKKQGYNPRNYGTRDGTDRSCNDGEDLWQKLVKKHANFRLVLSGHVIPGETGYLASRGDQGNVVHQMLYNRQMVDDGQMRLLEFLPDGRTVQVKTYSPLTDEWATDKEHNQYVMDMEAKEEGAATRSAK